MQKNDVQVQSESVATTVYERLTEQAVSALRAGRPPADAWAWAQTQVEGRQSTLNKGCPRSTFVSLAEHGYVTVYLPGEAASALSLNAQHALVAAAVQREHPEVLNNKRAWWEATQRRSGITRKGENGVLDVLRALIRLGVFRAQP